MRHRLLAVSLVALLAACQDAYEPVRPSGPAQRPALSAALGSELSAALAAAAPEDRLEVIATFDPSATTGDEVQSAILDLEAGALGYRHLPMVAALATPAQIEAIRTLPGVRGVYLNTIEQPMNLEAVQSVRADRVYTMQAAGKAITGKGVGIAIVDSGVDGAHPDVAYPSKLVQNVQPVEVDTKELYELPGRDSITGAKTPKVLKKGVEVWAEDIINTDVSGSGHGTHVAATAAGSGAASGGQYAGVAPGAHLVGINASTAAGLPAVLVLAAFDYILEKRKEYNIQLVNNSWGSTGNYDPNEPIPQASKALRDAGVTVVFAAGNSGPNQNTMNRRSVAPWVMSVAAGCKLSTDPVWLVQYCVDHPDTRRNEGDGRDNVLTWFSSRGIPDDPIQHPDIMAPGARIVSARASNGPLVTANEASWFNTAACKTDPAENAFYACISGTSMSSPVVSGVIALMEQATKGRIGPDETLEVLMSTAKVLSRYAFWEVGAGYVDAEAAVREAMRRYP